MYFGIILFLILSTKAVKQSAKMSFSSLLIDLHEFLFLLYCGDWNFYFMLNSSNESKYPSLYPIL